MNERSTVLILDYGSQYTQLIARRVRELGVFSKILPGSVSIRQIQSESPRAIILSGGPSSVYGDQAPQLPAGFLSFQLENRIPVLGVCYGMQLLVRSLGGEVSSAERREYGRTKVKLVADSALFSECSKEFLVWMSHGDEMVKAPNGFKVTVQSHSGCVAAIENPSLHLYALQFHPEVTHTEGGIEILKRFLIEASKINPNWNMSSVLDEKVDQVRSQVGSHDHAICALSGGVDSAVAAHLVHRALGDRLHCFFIDQGLLRFQEQARVMELFKQKMNLPVVCLDHSERFLEKLKGVEDPEKKRKIIGAQFIASFEEAADSIAQKVGNLPRFLVQGTLYPDVIESSPGHQHAETIKSHHNVGGLPETMKFHLIEPFRDLFKDEVRELGRKLGVSESFLKRHPFPGPGLAVRIIGEVTPERLELLREVDEVFIQSIQEEGLYDEIWQAFAVFMPIKSVGVQGDGRTHDHVVALRAVTSSDGMTADWYRFDSQFLAQVSTRICNQVRGVNRVVYDVTSKPPATIEWE